VDVRNARTGVLAFGRRAETHHEISDSQIEGSLTAVAFDGPRNFGRITRARLRSSGTALALTNDDAGGLANIDNPLRRVELVTSTFGAGTKTAVSATGSTALALLRDGVTSNVFEPEAIRTARP